MIAHTTAFVTPVVEQWLEREIAQWVHLMGRTMSERSDHEATSRYINAHEVNENADTGV